MEGASEGWNRKLEEVFRVFAARIVSFQGLPINAANQRRRQ